MSNVALSEFGGSWRPRLMKRTGIYTMCMHTKNTCAHRKLLWGKNNLRARCKNDWLTDAHTHILCTGNQSLEVRIYNK